MIIDELPMGPKRMLTLRVFLLLFLLSGLSVSQVTYVDVAATGAGTGTSWSDAFTNLQTALAATAQGDIWVAQGSYFAGPRGQRSATFQLKNGVGLYGGFVAGETSLAQRDVPGNPTYLSGDIDQNDTYGSGANWWQFAWSGSLGNSYHIVTGTGTNATAILDGFTIIAGRGDGPVLPGGAGLLVNVGSPTIKNCTFRYNAVGYGSAARLIDCNSVFENCVIKDGYTCNCGSGGWVSGILITGSSTVTFTDCDFLNHYYVSSQGQGRGAALNIGFGCQSTLTRCKFVGNQTGNFYPIGGGTAYGAGVVANGSVVADRCEFVDNFAHAGAGLTAWSDATITNCLFAGNRAVSHPSGAGFSDGNYGAGLLTLGFSNTNTIDVVNCTFADNQCDKGAGAAFYGASMATIRNCIFFDNFGYPPVPGEDIVPLLKKQIVGNYDLAHCCVEGLFETIVGEDPPNASNFPACFDDSPLFVNLANGDFHVQPSSPCISAGDNTALSPSLIWDLDENPRLVGAVDLGPYEFAGTAFPSLVSTNLVMGSSATFTVHNANPGEWVYFLYSISGVGSGPCFPAPINLCLDLNDPITVAAVVLADINGTAVQTAAIPLGLPTIDVWAQALMLRGPGLIDSVLTGVTQDILQLQP